MAVSNQSRVVLAAPGLALRGAKTSATLNWAVFRLAFRPFFLVGAGFGVLAIAAWLLSITGWISWRSGLAPPLWHAHEMLFGFGGAVAMGFLLTAAQTWTGVPSVSGIRLALLAAVWLTARILLWRCSSPAWLAGAFLCELAWWLGGIAALARMLFKSRNRRNYFFLPLLSVTAGLDLTMLGAATSGHFSFAAHLAQTAVLMFGLLMGLVGGRVIPFFTANALGDVQQRKTPQLDRLILICAALGSLIYFTGYFLRPPFSPFWIMLLTAALHGCRHLYWYPRRVLAHPLLWSLHLSYLALSIGMALIGLSYLLPWITFQNALHLITIGAMGLMILSMMSRVSLGHTGRQLRASRRLVVAYLLLAVAALVRAFGPQWLPPLLAWILAGTFWIVAFVLFLWQYVPILLRSRLDGRPG
ncbi:NnrS family protein [Microbulbifer hainanensis]|uniref:NnrS family protein n=1 Tax=Microbulbifer hainanensis TaxID=2735675 RepID=UPI0018682FC7|nr:NnrS family protein [Microbulbifer hainanensis]